MERIHTHKKNPNWFIGISFIIVSALMIVFMSMLSKSSLNQNLENRVFAELKSTSTTQATTLKNHLEEQYQPLRVIADMLANGESFADEKMQPVLQSMVSTHKLCMLGFADLDGNAIGYDGNERGNLSDRAYFSSVASGQSEQYCEYLQTTKSLNEPRVLFSVPAYQNGKLIGVLYCSKEINVLEETLFEHNELFDTSSIIFICDAEGNMIVANKTAHERCKSLGLDDEHCCVYDQVPDLETMFHANQNVQKINMQGDTAYASLLPLGINDWQLGCIVDEGTATTAYAANLSNIKRLTHAALSISILSLIYIVLLAYVYVRRKHMESNVINRSYENYKVLLHEMNCTVVEYDATDEHIFSVKDTDPYGINKWDGTKEDYKKYKALHPEFDFNELEKEILLVQKNNKTYSFESIIKIVSGELRWVKLILIPIINEDGMFKIFVAILDVSDVHHEFDDMVESFSQIPGGIHRCYLSQPIHLEYFSEGLCKMLGYTHAEVAEIVTPQQKYSLLIYPEDRPIFSSFVKALAEYGGTQTCEYRMICKDGSLLTVSDTMDAKRSSSGIMYGYSVVTDLHKYKEMQQQLEEELQRTKQQLEEARIKNSNSQMQPHFLYNALASIREIVLDDPEYASDLIYDFTTHLRACIRSMASDSLVSFAWELENIKSYVNIEKMRFGEKLRIQYDCPETDFDIIPLSIQPLVENAIRHGIYERGSDGGTVTVRSRRTEDSFIIQVDDDGVGFDFDTTMQEVKDGKRDSTGLFSLIFRLETLLKAKISIDSQIGIGTKITIVIPRGGENNNESNFSRR